MLALGRPQPALAFRSVESRERREAIRASFARANAEALNLYAGERRGLYAKLKLEGLEAAPVQLAVFADEETAAGAGLGATPCRRRCAIRSLAPSRRCGWRRGRTGLASAGCRSSSRAPSPPRSTFRPRWKLVAYLCIGWPAEEHLDPELERHGWQERIDTSPLILRR